MPLKGCISVLVVSYWWSHGRKDTLFCKKTPVPLIPGVVFCDRQVEENPMGTSWPRFTWKNHFYTNIVVYSVALCIHLCTMHKRAMCYVAGRMSLMNILKTCSCSHQLTVPHICHSTYGTCTFTGPTVWNSLSDTLHSSAVGLDHFQRDLKSTRFSVVIVSFIVYWFIRSCWKTM